MRNSKAREARRFFRWLVRAYPSRVRPSLKLYESAWVVHDVRNPEKCGFGIYHRRSRSIHVAARWRLEFVLDTLAHEYGHHLQVARREKTSESGANKFMRVAVRGWRSERRCSRRIRCGT